jgi:hypothetical protein
MKAFESFGGEIGQRNGEVVKLDMDMDKEGATLKNMRGSKFLDKSSTQLGGSKLMNFDWLHLICAYSCACLYCISC